MEDIGPVLFLLDGCHSWNISTKTIVPNNEFAQKLRSDGRSGIIVFEPSKERRSALESPDLGGAFGAFACSLAQTLCPKTKQADLNGNGFVEFMEFKSLSQLFIFDTYHAGGVDYIVSGLYDSRMAVLAKDHSASSGDPRVETPVGGVSLSSGRASCLRRESKAISKEPSTSGSLS